MDTKTNSKRQPIFIALAETQALITYLQNMKEGEVVPWDTLNRAAGVDVRTRRSVLYSARRRLEKDHQIVTSIIPEGLKRNNPEEVIKIGQAHLSRSHRLAKRGMRKLATVEYDALGDGAKESHNVAMATLGALAHASSVRSQKRLAEKLANNGSGPLLVGDTLRLFAGVTE